MKINFSELKFISYTVEESSFSTVIYNDTNIEQVINSLQEKKFTVDFNILESTENKDYFLINLKINSYPKTKRKKAGYDFKITLTAVFYLKNREKINADKQKQFILYSALPMTISLARSEIAHLTSNGHYGKFILPAIDLQNLVNTWLSEQLEK